MRTARRAPTRSSGCRRPRPRTATRGRRCGCSRSAAPIWSARAWSAPAATSARAGRCCWPSVGSDAIVRIGGEHPAPDPFRARSARPAASSRTASSASASAGPTRAAPAATRPRLAGADHRHQPPRRDPARAAGRLDLRRLSRSDTERHGFGSDRPGTGTPLRRVVMASMIGTTIEWYDFFLYGSAAALVFNRLFFPQFDPLTGTLLAFATYALGLRRAAGRRHRLRPFRRPDRAQAAADAEPGPDGRGDRADRPAADLCPDRHLGAAPADRAAPRPGLRGRRRMGRGGADGGRAWRRRPARLLGELAAGGRRRRQSARRRRARADGRRAEPRRISSPGAGGCRSCSRSCWSLVGWYIRNRVAESRLFEEAIDEADAPPKLPALDVFRERPKAVLLGAGLRGGENISYYILTVFSLTYLVDVAAESRGLALQRAADRRGGAVLRHSPVRRCCRTGSGGARSMRSAGSASPRGASPCFRLLGSGDNRSIVSRSGRRPRPSRRHVRAAGGVHHRIVPDPDPLFRRLDRLSADRRSSPARWRRSSPCGSTRRTIRRCRWRSMSAISLRDQRHLGAAGARDEGRGAGGDPVIRKDVGTAGV